MSVCYGFIVAKFRGTVVTIKKPSGNGLDTQQKGSGDADRRRVTIMCISLVVVFFVSWLLFHIVQITLQLQYFLLSVRDSKQLIFLLYIYLLQCRTITILTTMLLQLLYIYVLYIY